MQLLDWIILIIPISVLFSIAFVTRLYMKSVVDFMSGGRLAGRYLLTVARGEMASGAVVFVWAFEMIHQSGFVMTWWQKISVPITLLVAIFGFVTYRYRETKAMTLAQFFEIRYSRRFRIFSGSLGFVAGILNFGIIPAVGSRFLVYFLELPRTFQLYDWTISTYIPLMAMLLTFTVLLTISGGLISVMITDCVEGMMSQIFFVVIIIALLCTFSWTEISQVLMSRPPGHSMLNPFDADKVSDFNFTLVLMAICTGIYGKMAWQNASAYNSAALTPHEGRMSSLLGHWREMGKTTVVILLAVCGITFLEHADFAQQAAHAKALISEIPQEQIQKQMSLPIAVSEMLPVGIKGLFCAILIMGVFGGDSTHLHSWGGILVQDVIAPLRKKPFTPKEHIFMLRMAIIGVAFFAFLFGSLFQQTEYVTMWFSVTTGIFVGGAGSVIIGGLYWKRGTTAGAWAAMLTGSIISVTCIILRQIYEKAFPLNGAQVFFTVSLISITVYVIVSLLTCKQVFNMDKMLHRGQYALEPASGLPLKRRWTWGRIIGFDENFTLSDRWVAASVLGYGMFWFFIMLIGTICYKLAPWPLSVWSGFWHLFAIVIPVFFSVVTSIWFTWGGLRDLRDLLRRLKLEKVNPLDDGTVVDHQNLDEVPSTKPVSPARLEAAVVRVD